MYCDSYQIHSHMMGTFDYFSVSIGHYVKSINGIYTRLQMNSDVVEIRSKYTVFIVLFIYCVHQNAYGTVLSTYG